MGTPICTEGESACACQIARGRNTFKDGRPEILFAQLALGTPPRSQERVEGDCHGPWEADLASGRIKDQVHCTAKVNIDCTPLPNKDRLEQKYLITRKLVPRAPCEAWRTR